MTTKIEESLVEQAMHGMKWLADRCDYATSADGKGFSGSDAPLGHALAAKAGGATSPRERLAALKLVVKYQKQLRSWDQSIDISSIKQNIAKTKTLVGSSSQRLSKRDVVKGTISVDQKQGRVVLRAGYNEDLVSSIRGMIGRKWDKNNKTWTADLCAENAVMAEKMAEQFGLTLKKHQQWSDLVPARSVIRDGDRLIIHGVNAWNVVKNMPDVSGDPAEDEKIFRSVEIAGPTAVSIHLRSWIIKPATAWMLGIEDEHALGWARDDAIRLMGEGNPRAIQQETDGYAVASSGSLGDDRIENIHKTLPASAVARLMPHQWRGIAALMDKNQIILADEQGLGKTIEILMALEARQAWPAVVLSPATAVLNWRDEAHDWLPHRKVRVLGGNVSKRDRGCQIEDADILIINYESFAKYAEELAERNPIALVADEAQYLKGYASARTKSVKEFCKSTKSVDIIIAATGTPVLNRPAELLTLLTILPDVLGALGGFRFFGARYCRASLHTTTWTSWWNYDGAGNIGELANRIRMTGGFIRREKREVLPNLLSKDREYVQVEITNKKEYSEARDNFHDWLKTKNKPGKNKSKKSKPTTDTSIMDVLGEWMGDGWLDMDKNERGEALKQLGALRQLTGVGKIASAVDWIKKHVKDEKLVVFAYHIDVQRVILDALKEAGENPLTIKGEQAAGARRDAIQKFQNDDDRRIIVCSLKAAQTAITLTSARRALMVELDWTPAGLQQAEDRIHRIGQNKQVKITYLVGTDTFDDRMQEILHAKMKIVDKLAGNTKFGYRIDGTPRKQMPGPGRPRLTSETRQKAKKTSQSIWQAKNPEYMREYMQKRRWAKREKKNRETIAKFRRVARSKSVYLAEGAGYLSDAENEEMYAEDLAGAKKIASRAIRGLARMGINETLDG